LKLFITFLKVITLFSPFFAILFINKLVKRFLVFIFYRFHILLLFLMLFQFPFLVFSAFSSEIRLLIQLTFLHRKNRKFYKYHFPFALLFHTSRLFLQDVLNILSELVVSFLLP